MTIGLKQVLDYGDYACIPPDGKRYALLEGDVHVAPPPSPLQQWASKRLERQLEVYFETRGLGPRLQCADRRHPHAPRRVQPDLVVVTDPAQVSARGIEGAPALLVEVLSPGTVSYDRATKSRRYAALGVPHFWLLDPDSRRLECYRLEGQGYRPVLQAEGDEVVEHPEWPGLVIQLGDLRL
jgi:Uma2 family endonuclease